MTSNIDTVTSQFTAVETSISDWLATKRVTLWGSTWTVTEPAGREQAAVWFRRQMEDWVKWAEEEKDE